MIAEYLTHVKQNTSSADLLTVGISHAFHNKGFKPGYGQAAFGDSFIPTAITPAALVEHILGGGAFVPSAFEGISRTNDTWRSAQAIALDYDDNVSVEDVLDVAFIAMYALLVYPTPSSGKSDPDTGEPVYKTRVLFVLDQPIAGHRERYRAIVAGICDAIGLPADPASVKPAQLMYGSTNRIEQPYINLDARLPLALAGALTLPLAVEENERRSRPPTPRQVADPDDTRAQKYAAAAYENMLAEVASSPDGDHNNALYRVSKAMFGKALGGWPGFDYSRIEGDLSAIARGWEHHDDKKIRCTLASARKSAAFKPFTLPDNDTPAPRPLSQWQAIADPETLGGSVTKIDAEYLPADVLAGSGDILLKSDMGTGKTTVIAAACKGKRVLSITHRTALSAALAKALDLDNYKGLEGADLRRLDRLTITYNSLYKLADEAGNMPAYDVVILDEVTQGLAHLGGGTFKSAEGVRAYRALKQVVNSAGRVIAADAHMTSPAVKLLSQLRGPDRLSVVVNHHDRARGPLYVYDNPAAVVDKALLLASENSGPVLLATMAGYAQRAADRARALFGDEAVLLIYGENSSENEMQAAIKALGENIGAYRMVVYSPSLGSGIDIQAPVRAVCGVFFSEPLAAPEIHQMLNRARNAQEYHVYVDRKPGERETSAAAIVERHFSNALKTASEADYDLENLDPAGSDHMGLLRLLALLEAEQNASKNRLYDHFLTLARGYARVEFVEDYDSSMTAAALAEAGDRLAEQRKRETLATDPISPDEFRALQDAGTLRQMHHRGLLRWQIEKASGLTISPDLYDKLQSKKARGALYQLTNVWHVPDEELRAQDRRDAETSMHRRRHVTRKAHLQRWLLRDVFGGYNGAALERELTADEVEAGMARFMERNGDEAMRLFGRRSDKSRQAAPLLRWLLQQVGLRLISRQAGRGAARYRVYFIDPDVLTEQQALALTCRARQERDDSERCVLKTGKVELKTIPVLSTLRPHIKPPLGFIPSFDDIPPQERARLAAMEW